MLPTFLAALRVLIAICMFSFEELGSWCFKDLAETLKIVLPVAASWSLKGDIKSEDGSCSLEK